MAKEVASLHAEGEFGRTALAAIVKEIAPCPSAKTDEELGVGVFQKDYFNSQPVFLDRKKTMINTVGQKVSMGAMASLLWNIRSMAKRTDAKGIKGSKRVTAGDASVKGGVLVMGKGGLKARFQIENLGHPLDYELIKAHLRECQ